MAGAGRAAGALAMAATARSRSMTGRHAIILAAGAGSRLRGSAPQVKPLALVQGQPLIRHALDTLAAAGIASATVVVGREADSVAAAARTAPIPVEAVLNPLWASTPNGVSLLAAAAAVRPGTLLMMADHLITPLIVARLIAQARGEVTLAVDRRLGHPYVDEADVTRVRTGPDGAIRGLGKSLLVYDCYDTGVFLIGPGLIEALRRLESPSLSEGVMACGAAYAADIGDAPWLDVDDARAFGIAARAWRMDVCLLAA
jgi:choline kinase